MQVSLHNRVKTYNLTAGKSLPEWLSERRKHRRAAGGEDRVELLHDLEFPHCAKCIFRCPNGTHLFAAGDYPYRLKCFDVNELSMKYSFNADMEILSGVCLSPDYRTFALRGEGRQITLHHSAAIVERVKVPHIQRGLGFNRFDAELLSCGASPEIFRINLETGTFVESYKTESEDGVNHVEVCEQGPVSGVVLTAGCDGVLEAWDARSASRVARLPIQNNNNSYINVDHNNKCGEIRHVSAEQSGGLLFACGMESGEVFLYDIRLQRPLLVKDHMNGLPIVKTYFFHGKSAATGEASHVLSADTRAVKVWNKQDGSNFTSVEAPGDITDFVLLRSQHNLAAPYDCADSGVLAICCDVPRVQVHFIPQLGVAPRWASFLETLTEELETKAGGNNSNNSESDGAPATTVYDDYTFISKEEMDKLGLAAEDLAGGRVRPVMHGAFIENALYRELKAVVDPSAFSRYVAANAQRKKQERWTNRISRFHRVDEHNSNDKDEEEGKGQKSGLAIAKADPRFAKAFDPTTGKATAAFALDRSNPEYAKLLQTIEERRAKASLRRQRYEADLFSIVPDTEVEEEITATRTTTATTGNHNGEELRRAGDRAGVAEVKAHMRGVQSSGKVLRNKNKAATKQPAPSSSSSLSASAKPSVTMYEVKHHQADIFTRNDKQIHAVRKRQRAERMTLEERLARMQQQQQQKQSTKR